MQDRVVWAEIDLGAIEHNCREVKKLISSRTGFMAVVKANGYGHGVTEVAKIVLKNGATHLAVARLEEGIFLRENGIFAPILVFGYVPFSQLKFALEYNLILTIYHLKQAEDFSNYAISNDKKISCHLKVDTGMGRLGFVLSDESLKSRAIEEIFYVLKLSGLKIEGIYTHFACADEEDLSYSYLQLNRFKGLIKKLKNAGISEINFHAANSAATIQLPMSHFDMVRPGIMLYGLYPSEHIRKIEKVNLSPAMSLKAKIAQIKEVKKGFKISYGSTFVTSGPARLATIAVGYADGYPRILSSKGYILIKGKKAPILGRVCMDQIVVDVTGVDARMGDEVLIFGRDTYGELKVDEVAKLAQTINYEIVSSITSRVPRVYIK